MTLIHKHLLGVDGEEKLTKIKISKMAERVKQNID
jgi:hypothetical protein